MNEIEDDGAIAALLLMIRWLWRQDLLSPFVGALTYIRAGRVRQA